MTMSTTVGSGSASTTTAIQLAEEQVNDASTTNAEMEDVKTVLNGQQASVATSEED